MSRTCGTLTSAWHLRECDRYRTSNIDQRHCSNVRWHFGHVINGTSVTKRDSVGTFLSFECVRFAFGLLLKLGYSLEVLCFYRSAVIQCNVLIFTLSITSCFRRVSRHNIQMDPYRGVLDDNIWSIKYMIADDPR